MYGKTARPRLSGQTTGCTAQQADRARVGRIETNAKFLREELANTTIATLQLSLSRLLENELQTLMLARGNPEFAFRVVDRASPPKLRDRPKRTLLVAVATLGGGILSVIIALLVSAIRRSAPRKLAADPGRSAFESLLVNQKLGF